MQFKLTCRPIMYKAYSNNFNKHVCDIHIKFPKYRFEHHQTIVFPCSLNLKGSDETEKATRMTS